MSEGDRRVGGGWEYEGERFEMKSERVHQKDGWHKEPPVVVLLSQ